MTVVVGVDVGSGRARKRTGLCRTRDVRFLVSRATSDDGNGLRADILPRRCDVLAIGGPVVPPGYPENARRGVERIFSVGAFQKHCRPAASHVRGGGRQLRATTTDCVRQLAKHVATSRELLIFPHVITGTSIVETFPNAFLAVMLDGDVGPARRSADRGARFSWFLQRCRKEGRLAALRDRIDWPDVQMWQSLETCSNRDEQSALVCGLTAGCVVRKRYVAVGNLHEGYFFLPPWDLWASWAKQGLAENRRLPECAAVEIWINGPPGDRRAVLPA